MESVTWCIGIVLSWNMASTSKHEPAASYHLYAYQEGSEPPSTLLWKRVSCQPHYLVVGRAA